MTRANLAQPKQVQPLLFSGLTWREFKAIQQLLEQPGYRLSFLDGILEISKIEILGRYPVVKYDFTREKK